jgi:tellurite resistance protein
VQEDKEYGAEVTDIEIQTLVDGQCKEDEKRRIMEAIMSSPLALARFDELLRQNTLLRNWWNCISKD